MSLFSHLENVCPSLSDELQPQQEGGDAGDEREYLPGVAALPLHPRQHVHEGGDDGLHGDEAGVDGHQHQHGEEEHGPHARQRHQRDRLGVDDEDEAGAGVGHPVDGDAGGVGHVPEDGEDDAAAEERGEGVHAHDEGAVADKVAVELVVGAEGDHPAEGAGERVEHLGAGVHPNLEIEKRNTVHHVWNGK